MNRPGGILRVLHTRVVTGVGGGPEKTILNSPRYFRGSAYEEHACYYRPPNDPGFAEIQRRAAEAGCPLTGIDDSAPWNPAPLRATARLCRELGIRMWHGHDYKSNLFGLLLQPFFRFFLVTTVHGWVKHTARTPLYYAIDRRTLRYYHLVVAVSTDLVDACRDAGVPASRLLLIENGIDTEVFKPSAGRSARTRRAIGCVGRLSPEKGFDVAIAAFARLVRAGHDIELKIAGEGSDAERLKAIAAAEGVAERVALLGYCNDVRGFLDSIDVFCLSSLREGLPNVVLEAMAMRLPIVATTAGGMAAFGRDGTDMLLVAPAARARAEADLSFRRRMALMKDAYDRLIADGPGHALPR